jgi:effector-binding domain-containing protein
MEAQLEATQQTVASLRTLLRPPADSLRVTEREIAATPALAIREHVKGEDAVAWWMEAFTLLHQVVRDCGARRNGPDGALFPPEFFEAEGGEVTVFVPVDEAGGGLPDRVVATVVPGVRAAVAVHDGPFADLDRTYGALGTWVLERSAGAPGPIREYYVPTGGPDDLLAHTTDVCWPVS